MTPSQFRRMRTANVLKSDAQTSQTSSGQGFPTSGNRYVPVSD
jgi:hypothetical protein